MKLTVSKMLMVYTLITFMAITKLIAQPGYNLEKYWVYRERMKNFMVSGDCQGCSIIPDNQRQPYVDAWDYNDQPWDLGRWIGTLAIEYHLLKTKGYTNKIQQTKKDLFYAIEAINRLDKMAEIVYGCDNSINNNLNGFIIPDDVPGKFWSKTYNGDSIKDLMNETWVPRPDRFDAHCFAGGLQKYDPSREASMDHWVGLFIGFRLVEEFVPTNATWQGREFMDGETSMVREVQNIAQRFIDWNVEHSWRYYNACTDTCVWGVRNDINTTNYCKCSINNNPWNFCDGKDVEKNCNAGGAQTFLLSYAFALANCEIQEGRSNSRCADPLASTVEYSPLWVLYLNNDAGEVRIDPHPFDDDKIGPFKNAARKHMALAALSNVWQEETPDTLVARGKRHHFEHHILLHRIFYGDKENDDGETIKIADNFYKCLLNAAPCRGWDGFNRTNVEWSCGNRLFGGRGCNPGRNNYRSGIQYLFYFNLYHAVNPNYTNYEPISIKKLAKYNIHKSNHNEYLKKHFQATNNITSQNYSISNFSNPINGMNETKAGIGKVIFRAGEKIVLKDGFKVTNGGYFHGYIDSDIEIMNCLTPPSRLSQFNTTDCATQYEDNTTNTASFTPKDSDSTGNNNINKNQTHSFSGSSIRNTPSEPLIYPNPGSDHFHLIAPSFKESYNVRVLNSVGQTVKRFQNVTQFKLTIDIHQPGGVYIVKLKTNKHSYTKRWVKQ